VCRSRDSMARELVRLRKALTELEHRVAVLEGRDNPESPKSAIKVRAKKKAHRT